ncbi:MAG: hypothetical protein ACRD9L_17420, partial [Bryobacteraceae bacterium]
KQLGKAAFLQWCTFPLGAIDKLLPTPSGIVSSARTGHRTVEAVARGAAAPLPKAALPKAALPKAA